MVRNYRKRIVEKKIKCHGNKRILVWAAISFDRPKLLYFIKEKEN
jgi:hypothetical protein